MPGCVATEDRTDEVLKNPKKALVLHVEGLKEDGLPIPEPVAQSTYVLHHFRNKSILNHLN